MTQEDTFVKSQEISEGTEEGYEEAEDLFDAEEDYPKAGDLVLEQGEYTCADCGYVEFFSSGEEFPECDCYGEKGWILTESENDSEQGYTLLA